MTRVPGRASGWTHERGLLRQPPSPDRACRGEASDSSGLAARHRPTIGLVPDFRSLPPAQGGIDVYSQALLAQLLPGESRYRFVVFIADRYRDRLPLLGEHVATVPVPAAAGGSLRSIWWYLTVLPRLARRCHVDLLHLLSGNRCLAPCPGAATLATVHDVHHHDSIRLYGPSSFIFFRSVLVPLLKRQDHIIAVSASTARQVEERLGVPPARITTVPNGIDRRRFRVLASGEEARRVRAKYSLLGDFLLFVSSLEHPRKNHIGLVRAYRRLRETTSRVGDLVLVGGDGYGAAVIHRAIARAGLAESVRVLGPIPGEDLVALYNTAQAFVHPSTREGFGLPVLEAMACGLPVACSDIPAFREVAGDAAVFFDPHDAASMAEAVLTVCRDGGVRDECRARGLARAELFSWESTARRVTEVYDQLLCARLGSVSSGS